MNGGIMPCRIAYDARMCQHSGIGVYIQGLFEGLSSEDMVSKRPNLTFLGCPNPELLPECFRSAQNIAFDAPIYGFRERFFMPTLLNVDLLHVPHYNVPHNTHGIPFTANIFDLIHLTRYSSLNQFKRAVAQILLNNTTKHAKHIITCSEFSKQDIMRSFDVADDKISVIYPAISEAFVRQSQEIVVQTQQKYSVPANYFMAIGSDKSHKNLKLAIDAYNSLCSHNDMRDIPSLVIRGLSDKSPLSRYARETQAFLKIIFLPFIESRAEFAALMQGASAVIFPSLYEGFGLPVIEAQRLRVPVISSSATSMCEAGGHGGALYFDPNSSDDLIGCMKKLLSEPSSITTIVDTGYENQKRFSWHSTASQTIDVWNKVCKYLK